MQCSDILTLIGIFASAFFGIFSIFQSVHQMKRSNDLELFEKRIDVYRVIRDISNCIDQNAHLIESENDVNKIITASFLCSMITNAESLEGLCVDMKHPLKDNDLHRKYLFKKQELTNIGEMAPMVFKTQGEEIRQVVLSYLNFVNSLYLYQIWYKDRISQVDNEKFMSYHLDNANEAQKKDHQLIVNTWNKLKEDYNKLNLAMIKNQTTLF